MKKLLTAFILATTAAPLQAAIVINEFRPNPTGTDPATQTIELRATSGETSFNGFYGSIESDTSTFSIDRSGAISVNFDAQGLATLDIPDLENPAFTFFLSTADHSSAAAVGDITSAIDALGVPDQASGDTLYGAMLGGVDLVHRSDNTVAAEPVLVFRESSTLGWFAVHEGTPDSVFDAAGLAVSTNYFSTDATAATFGSANPVAAVPEPGSLSLLALAGIASAFRRRRA